MNYLSAVQKSFFAGSLAFCLLLPVIHAEDFMRVYEDNAAIRLQVAVTRYEKADVSVDLYSDIHMADESFLKTMNTRFKGYEAVLFELVGSKPKAGEKADAASMYGGAAKMLGLVDGSSIIDLTADNMIHADLTGDEFNEMLSKKGETASSLLSKIVRDNMAARDPAESQRMNEAVSAGKPDLAKLQILQTNGKPGGFLGTFTKSSVLIAERNERCIEVLKHELSTGRKHLAILYGAAHMPDLQDRLLAIGFKRINQEWLTAWDVPKSPANPSAAITPSPVPEPVPVAAGTPVTASSSPALEPATVDPKKFKTADEFWEFVQRQEEEPTTKGTVGMDEALALMRSWLDRKTDAANAFVAAYPNDPRRWDARLMAADASLQRRRYGLSQDLDNSAFATLLQEVQTAPDASAEAKGEAAYFEALAQPQDEKTSTEATIAKVLDALSGFIEKYPEHRRALSAAQMELQAIDAFDLPNGEQLLKKLLQSVNPAIAGKANEVLARRGAMAQLKAKPIELAFKAANGQEMDLAKLRGKVVLIDFWASWCGPCMAEMPNVVKTYNALHEKGFEVLGISLDENLEKMQAAAKQKGAAWPQCLDNGAQETKISTRFGIAAIPATWLIDKKGMLRESGLRGEALLTAVEKLLAEE